MPSPLGYSHINERGPRGWLARWWLRRRVRQVTRAMEAGGHRKPRAD